jgi:hypothetical protein
MVLYLTDLSANTTNKATNNWYQRMIASHRTASLLARSVLLEPEMLLIGVPSFHWGLGGPMEPTQVFRRPPGIVRHTTTPKIRPSVLLLAM